MLLGAAGIWLSILSSLLALINVGVKFAFRDVSFLFFGKWSGDFSLFFVLVIPISENRLFTTYMGGI